MNHQVETKESKRKKEVLEIKMWLIDNFLLRY